jgi:hypothetical protein
MAKFVLRQKIEKNLYQSILSKPAAERNKLMTEQISENEKERVRDELRAELCLKNPLLAGIGKSAIDYLLTDIGYYEKGFGFRKIIEPDEQDIKYRKLYACLCKFDDALNQYSFRKAEMESEARTMESKIMSAEERKSRLVEIVDNAKTELSAAVHITEKTRLETRLVNAQEELSNIDGQIINVRQKLEALNRKKQVIYSDFDIPRLHYCAYEMAKQVGLESLLNLDFPKADYGFLEFNENTLCKADTEAVLDVYELPKQKKKKGKLAYVLAGCLFGAVLAIASLWPDTKQRAQPIRPRREYVQRTPRNPQERISHRKLSPAQPEKAAQIEQTFNVAKPYVIFPDNKKYITGFMEMKSFNPETKELITSYSHGGDYPPFDLNNTLPIPDSQLKDQLPDIVLLGYKSDSGNVGETRRYVALQENGSWLFKDGAARDVPKKEIEDHVREFVKIYELRELLEADMFIKGKKLLGGAWHSHKNLLVLNTTKHGSDIELHLENVLLSSPEHDRIPELGISFNSAEYFFLDFAFSGDVKWVKPKEGERIDTVQISAYKNIEMRVVKGLE